MAKAKVIVIWEKAAYDNRQSTHKHLKKFYHTAKALGATLEVVDYDGSLKTYGLCRSYNVHDSLEDVINENEKYVLMEPKNKCKEPNMLSETELPEDCTFVVWSNYGTTPFDKFPDDSLIISIDTTEEQESMWASVALGIVLYDWYVQWL